MLSEPLAAVVGMPREAFVWAAVAAGAAGAASVSLLRLLVRRGVHPPEVTVAPWPLTPGAPAEVRFTQHLKRSFAPRELRAELTCKESATYDVGTESRTDTATRLNTHLPPVDLTGGGSRGRYEPARSDPARRAVTAVWNLDLPPDLPPSLEVRRNAVAWTLEITLVIDRRPDVTTTFALHVL